MATTKPKRGQRAKTNAAKRVKAKVNPMDKKAKTTASKSKPGSKVAGATGGYGTKKKPGKKVAFGSGSNASKKKRTGKSDTTKNVAAAGAGYGTGKKRG